jgi:hypothetical protein
MRKLIAMLMLAAAMTSPVHALEVGDIFDVGPNSDIRSCDSLEALRSGRKQNCGTIPPGSDY